MARGICHAHRNRLPRRHDTSERTTTQTSASQGTTTTDGSQRTRPAGPHEVEPPKKRGRTPGKRTKLKPLPPTGRVALIPSGDSQFSYVNYNCKLPYKYTTQLGVIIKREYPGLLEEREEDGRLIRERPALDWPDYFLGSVDRDGRTKGEHVLHEFWRLFEVEERLQVEVDRVLDIYLKKRVWDMMHQARLDCVKAYYRKRDESINDAIARTIELEYEYRLDWFNDAVWPILCAYWCSEEFKTKRKIGQECRSSFDDIAQNHGGYRPLQQVLGLRFGQHRGTPIYAFSAMKSGMKNIDSNGNCGPIKSNKAQQRLDGYIEGVKKVTQVNEEHEDDGEHGEHQDMEDVEQGQGPEHEKELNAKVLYDMSGGLSTHGRFAIGFGAVRAADVRAAAKENNALYRRLGLEHEIPEASAAATQAI
ncbi:hypothetical protein BDA96_10G127900, partial [Sorghum bicolor]